MIYKKKKKLDANLLQAEFLNSIKSIVGLDQLLNLVSSKLKEMFCITSIHIFLLEPITHIYQERITNEYDIQLGEKLSIRENDRLIKWLYVNQTILDVEKNPEILKYLTPKENECIKKINTKIIVPLFAMNQLTSIFFLGERNGKIPYKQSEIKLIETLAGISALAIEYTISLKFQEDRLKNLLHSDKLIMIGELAAGTAHEIRNPLTSIKSTIQYLQKNLPENKVPLSQNIISEIDRIDKIIKGLLTFSKHSELKYSEIDLEEFLNQITMLILPEIKSHHIELKIENHTTGDMVIWGDNSQLKQVFLNILLNSIQAITQDGVIKIDIFDYNSAGSIYIDRNTLCIIISDNGKGIKKENLSRVFEPFYSTKENGTGLGLSITYGIIKQHNGDIEIKSNNDTTSIGTTVIIKLPTH